MRPHTNMMALVLLLGLWFASAAPRLQASELACLGDSLTAGYGVAASEAWPALVAGAVAERGWTVQNAGVSGDTSGGALSRLQDVLGRQPAVVIVAIGANDGLRGFPVPQIRHQVQTIVERCQAAGARVLLAGMQMPPSYGRRYTEQFAGLYRDVVSATGCAYYPFLLDGVAADPALNLADGIHPNAAGHAVIAERLLPVVTALLDELAANETAP